MSPTNGRGESAFDTAAYGHCCIGGIDQPRNDKQCVVPGGVSVPVRSVFRADAHRFFGRHPAELLRWAAVLDLFSYYLATAVLAYVLWRQLRPRNPLIADLSTMAAVGYALAGGVGAAVLAMVAPTFMHNYADATAAGQALIAAQFATVLQVVWRAIWQFLLLAA